MADTGVIDAARQEEFVGKVVEQISGTMTTLLGAVGDRLGLFKNLAEQGPATSAELASRTNLNERYLREWLGGMATAGYLDYDGTKKRFTLPAEHAAVLAQENGPFFVGGMYQMLPAFSRSIRPGFDCVSQWRWRFAITVQRDDVGRPGTVYLHMV